MRREDLLFMAAAVFVAVLLWLQVQPLFQPDREREFTVGLEVRNTPTTMAVVRGPDSIRVVASGTQEELDRLDSRALTAFVDLSRAKLGTHDYSVEISAPARSAVSIAPRQGRVQIDLERIDQIRRPVLFQATGVPSSDLLVDGASVTPQEVTIIGPESYLAKVHMVRVLFDMSKVTISGTYTEEVNILDENGRALPFLTAEPRTVTVSPEVAAAPARKRVIVSPVWRGSPGFGFRVVSYEIVPAQIELEGDSAALARLSTLDTEPIDISDITETTTREVAVRVPTGLRASVRQVRVVVRLGPASVQPPAPATIP